MTDPLVVALFGATAVGKSDVAVELAALLDAEIVVADSMQVYAGLPILTNQPDAAQRRRAVHHLVGFVPPQQEFTAAEFASAAHAAIDSLLAQGRAVVVEGGSGLYLRAALGSLEFGAPPDEALRRQLERRWAEGPLGVVDELERRASGVAARIDIANGRRVIRALENALGTSAGEESRLWAPPERYAHRLFALRPDDDREGLKARIAARVRRMLAAGALDEVRAARAAGPISRTAAQAIGVREMEAVIDGTLAQPDAETRMAARTRTLARRQLTWMRKLPNASVVPVEGRDPAAVAEELAGLCRDAP